MNGSLTPDVVHLLSDTDDDIVLPDSDEIVIPDSDEEDLIPKEDEEESKKKKLLEEEEKEEEDDDLEDPDDVDFGGDEE